MNPSTSHQSQSKPSEGGQAAPWNLMSELGRQQFAMAAHSASALFRGIEAMRKIQLQAAHQASAQHRSAAEKLQSGCGPAELANIQSALLRFDLEGAVQYWQQLAGAALEMQTEMMGCAAHQLDSEAMLEAMSALDTLESAVPGLQGLLGAKPARRTPAARRRSTT